MLHSFINNSDRDVEDEKLASRQLTQPNIKQAQHNTQQDN